MQLHVAFWSSGITRLVLGIVPICFFPRTSSFTYLSFVDAPNPLTGHSCLLHTLHVVVGTRGLTFVQNVPLPSTHLPTVCLQVSVTICAVVRFSPRYLHRLREGLPSYTLRKGSGQMDGCDVYGVIGCLRLIVVFGVGMQLLRRLVMTRRPNAGAGGGCYLFPAKFVRVKVA